METKTKTRTSLSVHLTNFLQGKRQFSRTIVSSGADPWVLHKDGQYYYCRVLDDWQILVNRAKRLEEIGKHNHKVWESPVPDPSSELWAPELHYLSGKWYIYFTMGVGEKHRMYVLEAKTDNPQGEYVFKDKISDASDKWAIDGTVLELNRKLFLIWSGWEGESGESQNLYIAPMSNPWTISGERVCISAPEFAWERATMPELPPVNEGPEILQHNGRTFIIYSASHSLTNDYCLGQLSLEGDDPLLRSSWKKKDQPVFCSTTNIFGPGHASFTKHPDGSDWIIYHTAKYSHAGWDRRVQIQEFGWHADGSPDFGSPLAVKVSNSRLATRKFLAGFKK